MLRSQAYRAASCVISSCLPGDFVLRRSACCQTARFRPEVQSSAEPGSNVEQLSLLPDTHDVHQVSAMLDGSCVGIVSADVLAPSTGLKSDFQLHEPHDAVHISRATDPKEERLVLVSFFPSFGEAFLPACGAL